MTTEIKHLKLRKAKIASVPTQISSRFEDQLEALKSRGYKERAVLYQFQLVLLRSREEVMEKVVRTEDERAIILAIPFDRRLPDVASILHQHYNLLVQRNPGVKDWMVRAPIVAHLRPSNLRDFQESQTAPNGLVRFPNHYFWSSQLGNLTTSGQETRG